MVRTSLAAACLMLACCHSALAQQAGGTNITTNTTTTPLARAGTFDGLCINTKGATSAAVVYDNIAGSGRKIATIDTTAGPSCLHYEAVVGIGVTVVTTGGTPADLTVLAH